MYQEVAFTLRSPEGLRRGRDRLREAGMDEGSRLDVACRHALGPDAVGGMALDPLAAGLERLVSCPACGLPAEILDRFSLASTAGAIAHIALGCFGGHFFRMAVDRLPAEVPLLAGR
jgi:hypothetical protein